MVTCARPLALAATLGVAGVLGASPSWARHTETQRITDDTAYTLPAGNVRLGLWKQQWGPWSRLTLGTYAAAWLLRFPNAHVKWRFYGADPLSLSAQLGVARFVPRNLEQAAGSAEIVVVPIELLGSYRFDPRWTLSSGFGYTAVTLRGSYDPAQLDGLAAVDNLQLLTTLEFRLTEVTAFVVAGRYLVFQRANGRISATLQPDAYTTVELQSIASTNALDFPFAFSIVPSVAFSWTTFNLRFGLGYGNYSVPMLNLVLPKKTVVPDLDLSWVF